MAYLFFQTAKSVIARSKLELVCFGSISLPLNSPRGGNRKLLQLLVIEVNGNGDVAVCYSLELRVSA